MTDSREPEAGLSAVFDELVDLVHETGQAVWSASSTERRKCFEELQMYLTLQAAAIDDAEQRGGGRPAWETEPSAHQVRNILGQAGDDPDRVVEILVSDLCTVVADVRHRSEQVDGELRNLLSDVVAGLEQRIDDLRSH